MKKLMMTRLITAGAVAGSLLLSGLSFAAINSDGFSDMATHWSGSYVTPLTDRGIITGYGDGTFKPDNTLKRIEFIVLTLKALESEGVITLDAAVDADTYWGMPYINKAIELKLLENYTMTPADYETAIAREEMASIIVKAYDAIGGDTTMTEGVTTKAQNQIGDLVNVSSNYKTEVTTAYALNFIAGYGDGSFKPLGSATRGEASVVISKLLDDSLRTPIEEDKPLEGDASWLEWVKAQPTAYQEENLMAEHLESTFEDGKLTIKGGSFGYDDLVVSDAYTPDLTARLNNLLSYMVKQDRFTALFTTNNYNDNILCHFIIVNFAMKEASLPYGYFTYLIRNDSYFDPVADSASTTKKGCSVKLTINALYDDQTNYDDEFWTKRYDERYLTLLKDSLKAFFGEPYGDAIADYVQEIYVEYYVGFSTHYAHYDEVTRIGNVDILVPRIRSSPKLEICFTVY
jgi:hypothetical protein